MRRVQIVAAQRAQLLPPQRRVIGQREHHPVSDRLVGDHAQKSQPFGLAGDPRQLHHPWHQRARPSTGPSAGRITAPTNGIRLPHAFFDQEVVEQSNRHQTLLQSRVRQPRPRVQRHHVGAAPTRPRRQLPHKHRHLAPGRGQRVDALPFTDLQILRQTPRIRIDGSRCTPQIHPDPQPLQRPIVPAEHRPLRLHRLRHAADPSSPRSS